MKTSEAGLQKDQHRPLQRALGELPTMPGDIQWPRAGEDFPQEQVHPATVLTRALRAKGRSWLPTLQGHEDFHQEENLEGWLPLPVAEKEEKLR